MFGGATDSGRAVAGHVCESLCCVVTGILLAVTALVKLWIPEDTFLFRLANWLGEPLIVMLLAVLNGMYLLGLRRGDARKESIGDNG